MEEPWQSRIDDVAPTVLIIGGFLTSPIFYRPMRARLLARGAAAVVVANVWTTDWLLAGFRGLGPIVGRGARALAVARTTAAATPASAGAPVLVVGHSGGGIVARLLTAEHHFAGRRHGFSEAIGTIVTLGSPHQVASSRFAGRQIGAIAARFANHAVPGAAFAPRVGYVSVASRAIVGRPDGDGRSRVGFALYRALLPDAGDTNIPGDGVVPVRSALLDGARQIVLEDVLHGPAAGRPWYGADAGLDVWWPEALAAWRAALRARVTPADSPLNAP